MKRGKQYQERLKKYDKQELYLLEKAVGLVKEMAFAKFDETVEIALKMNIKAQHTIRDTLVLPNSFTADKKILVFAKGDKAQEAQESGATHVGDDDLIAKIKGGWLDFDVAVATPDMMKDVGKLGPVLGRRGLMPNPKTQTVTLLGIPEPFSIPQAFFIRTAAGGVLVIKLKLLSAYTVITTGIVSPGSIFLVRSLNC